MESILQIAGAVSALGRFDRDLAAAVGALLGGGSSGSFFLLLQVHQLVDTLQDNEEDESSDDEGNDRGQEGGQSAANSPGFAAVSQGSGAAGEDQAQQGVQDITGQVGHDRGESAANDDTNGHIQHIATGNEFFEFFQKLFHILFPPRIFLNIIARNPRPRNNQNVQSKNNYVDTIYDTMV